MNNTLRFAVIGHPIAHSRSPDIHHAFAQQFGIDLHYDRIDVQPDAFEATVRTFFEQGGCGLNVTVPFKERAWQMAGAHLSPRAASAGAVNTLWQAHGQLHGCNTDGVGLIHDLLRLNMTIEARHILLIGAGGAARGVLGALLAQGCSRLHVINRTAKKAHELVQQWVHSHPDESSRLSAGGFDDLSDTEHWHLVINATASSLHVAPLPLPDGLLGPSLQAYDMMYGAKPTTFLQQAMQAGVIEYADGLGMLVGQAAESFRIWLDRSPKVEPVIQALRAAMGK
jgi:shikimate dehydrogenase